MQHMQENLQLKAGCLRNVTIAGQKFKNIPVYGRGGKGFRSIFREYKDSLTEVEGSVGFGIFQYVVWLLTMCRESKYGFYTYYIEFWHGKNGFGAMLDSIIEMGLNVNMGIWKTLPQTIR